MKYIKYGEPLNVLIVVKGHPFDREALGAMFEEMDGITASFIDQPAAAHVINPDSMKAFDALVFYDMPGLDFRAKRPGRPAYVEPPAAYKDGLRALLTQGKGIVALHHAIAGWPAWPDYAEWLGGRFLYRAGPLRGRHTQDGGYRHDITYTAKPVNAAHPVLEGLPSEGIKLTDEVYLSEVFEEDVTPLLRADYSFVQENFFSAELAVSQGKMFSNEDWSHAPGSNLVGWTKRAINSPLVYLQPGDGPVTYNSADYRRLVLNAIRWVASPDVLARARDSARPWNGGL
jgi:type 1 glutamine amidotransferase